MKRSLTMICTLLVGLMGQVATVHAHLTPSQWKQTHGQSALRWAPESRAKAASWKGLKPAKSEQLRTVTEPDANLDPSENAAYLDMPDGTSWFVTANYEKEVIFENEYFTQYDIKGVKATIYDDQYKQVGYIDALLPLPEGYESCSQVQFAPLVTRKFFNTNDSYEVMIMAVFKPVNEYGAQAFTYVYSLNGTSPAELVSTIKGYYVAEVNNAPDQWSEDFFIEFFSGEQYTDTQMLYTFDVYSKASYSSPTAELLQSFTVDMMHVMSDGENEGIPVLLNSRGRDLYVTVAQYEKTFFEDPFDFTNDNLSPDNHFQIELYKKGGYDDSLELLKTTSIPVDDPSEGYAMRSYALGMFSDLHDITFDYGTGELPAYILSIAESTYSDEDDVLSRFIVYDTDGAELRKFGAGNQGFIQMSDVQGEKRQYCFLMPKGDNLEFTFYDYPQMDRRASLPLTVSYGEYELPLSFSLDRVGKYPFYNYVVASSQGIWESDTHPKHPVMWFDHLGSLLRVDMLDGGEDVAMINPYINGKALSPYVFNTDELSEYMMYVKRELNAGSSAARTELMVVNSKGDALLNYPFDINDSGINVAMVNLQTNPALWVIHEDADDDLVHCEFVTLPFNSYEGSGTVEDPWLIKTAGDWDRMAMNPDKNYRLAADISFEAAVVKSIETFTGTIDGAGHSLNSFKVSGKPLFGTVMGSGVKNCVIKNLKIYRPISQGAEAILAESSSRATFENIIIADMTVTGNPYQFGAIAGNAGIGTEIKGCVAAGNIDLPNTNSVGGITGKLGNDSKVIASSFEGNLEGATELGGIAGSSFASAAISDCHVKAKIYGKNTIGGIVGSSARSDIRRCAFEGDLYATEAKSSWSEFGQKQVSEINVGGIAGVLESKPVEYDQDGNPKQPDPNLPIVIQDCVVDIDAISIPADESLKATCHRIVGYTSVNGDPLITGIEYDEELEDWVYIWGDEAPVEDKIANNYSTDRYAPVDESVAPEAMTTEGATLVTEVINQAFYESLGYSFGSDIESPWTMANGPIPVLWGEEGAAKFLYFDNKTVVAKGGDEVEVSMVLRGIYFEDCTVESSDEDNCYVKSYHTDYLDCEGCDNQFAWLILSIVKTGDYTLTVSHGEHSAVLQILGSEPTSGIGDLTVDIQTIMTYDGREVRAEGSSLQLFSLQGVAVAKGRDVVSVQNLAPGIYVAVAVDANGKASTLKLTVR